MMRAAERQSHRMVLSKVETCMKTLAVLAFASVLVTGASAATPAPAPHVAAATIDDLAKPLPLPYDEKADAHADLAAAIKRAKRERKRLLIDMGGNWCPDCRVLAGIFALPEVRPFLDRHFVIVEVDIGRYDKNLDIVDPKTNRLVNDGHTLALRDARHMTPQALADWLAQWT
jgi:thioredoxin-related protein